MTEEQAYQKVQECISGIWEQVQSGVAVHPATALTALEVVVARVLLSFGVSAEDFFDGVRKSGLRLFGQDIPAVRAECIHCKQKVCAVDDAAAIREHTMSCAASPVVRKVRELQRIVDQAEVVARHWETQDGINGTELDKLRDIVFDRPELPS